MRKGSTRFALLGYMTVYEYFAYPQSLRPRVSQVLVFPPYQRAGHGTRLLQHFYDECRSRSEVIDIPGAKTLLSFYAQYMYLCSLHSSSFSNILYNQFCISYLLCICIVTRKSHYTTCIFVLYMHMCAVEDPSENYQRMRDTLDCRNAVRECPLFAIGALPTRFTVELAAQAAETLKLVKVCSCVSPTYTVLYGYVHVFSSTIARSKSNLPFSAL